MSRFLDPNDPKYSDTPDVSLHPLEGEKRRLRNTQPMISPLEDDLRPYIDMIDPAEDGPEPGQEIVWDESSPAPAGLDVLDRLERYSHRAEVNGKVDADQLRKAITELRAATRPAEDAEAITDANGDELEHGEPDYPGQDEGARP